MCGIAGFFGGPQKSLDTLREVVTAMSNRLTHRGPDHFGVWADPSVPIALGHRRLAIIDLSPSGHQPMISASGRFVLIFNGEIYNYAEIRSSLGRYPFAGTSDTEVMLAAFEEYGIDGALETI